MNMRSQFRNRYPSSQLPWASLLCDQTCLALLLTEERIGVPVETAPDWL